MRLHTILALAASAALGFSSTVTFADSAPIPTDKLIVHEWGTFTALQDEHGKAIGGINTDDEPVPSFVHDLHGQLIQSSSELPFLFIKGWPSTDQDVIVRLETPVIYFHLPPGSGPMKLDVDVQFKGGWLTQFYPDAKAEAKGLADAQAKFGVLNEKTVGSLAWHGLTVGSKRPGPDTKDHVWTAPRAVDADGVSTPAGESERYLFYRGVGHINAPLQVSRSGGGQTLEVRSDWGGWVRRDPNFSVGPLWLVDVKPDGTSAVRSINPMRLRQTATEMMGEIPATFTPSDYRADNLSLIRRELKTALIHDGLYGDEADGLLNTWEVSYFKRPGLRLFFMVPPIWTENYLPLRISQSAYTTRVMVGRIELVTPTQRELLSQISKGPISKPTWFEGVLKGADAAAKINQLYSGKQTLAELGVKMPADYRAYLDLGRFRNALVLETLKNHPSPQFAEFVKNYELGPSQK